MFERHRRFELWYGFTLALTKAFPLPPVVFCIPVIIMRIKLLAPIEEERVKEQAKLEPLLKYADKDESLKEWSEQLDNDNLPAKMESLNHTLREGNSNLSVLKDRRTASNRISDLANLEECFRGLFKSVYTETKLTSNAISAMFHMNGSSDNPFFVPTVQVLHINRIDNMNGQGDERFKVSLVVSLSF